MCMCTPNEQVDDFAVAQRTPLPVCLAGVEGDKVSARLSSRKVPLLYLPERIQPCFHHPPRTPPARI